MKWAIIILLGIVLVCAESSAWAQEITGLGGPLESHSRQETTFSWQIEYMEGLGEHFAYSLTYLNEGHLATHHRDGDALLFWGRTSFLGRQLVLGAGMGPMYYYDTSAGNNTYTNQHGWGGMFSGAVTWYTAERLFYQIRTNWVITDRSIDTRSLLFGLGYKLGPVSPSGPSTERPPEREISTKNEVTLFAGQTILNSYGSELFYPFCIEYRRSINEYLDGTISYLYEAGSDTFRRSGPTAELWVVRSFFDNQFSLGFGAGLYAVVKYHNTQYKVDNDFLSGIVSITADYRFHPHWGVRFTWHRIVTDYSADTDVILGGIGYHF